MNRKQNSKDFIDLDQVYNFIEKEKLLEPNPYLVSKISNSIENPEVVSTNVLHIRQNVLNPILLSISVAAAITIGIVIGNLYNPKNYSGEPTSDFAYMNDAAIESVILLSSD